MTRILFLTPQLPYPPHQGTALRNYGLIRGLAPRHPVSLLTFVEPHQQPSDAEPLFDLCQRIETVPAPPRRRLARRALDTLVRRRPDMGLRLASSAFAQNLVTWLEREPFDVVHLEGLEMAPFLDQLEAAQPRPFILFDDHNCEYALQRRYLAVDVRRPHRWAGALYSLIQWQKLRPYEAQICRRADHVLAVSQTDAEALHRLVPGLAVTVVPNGIDVSGYDPEPAPEKQTDQAPSLVFTGKMDFRPNVDAVLWFADQILPRVRRQASQARFLVVGQRPHPRLERLRADPAITLTGWVEDVRPYIAQASVYVTPLRMGSGTRLKLLEALALAKPVVSTRLGAEGFPLTDGQQLRLVADDDPAAFAQAVLDLLGDPARRSALGRAGRRFVEENYDWGRIIPRLERVYPTQERDG